MKVLVLGSYVSANCLCVERLPLAGESLAAQALWVEHGGKGLNLAVGLHRLGLDVEVLLAIGNDAAGDALLDFLRAEGLDTRWVIKAGERSGLGIGLIAADGSNVIVVYPGANALLDKTHVQTALGTLESTQLVCAQFEIPDAPILEAFRHARSCGINTLLNPSPWRVPSPSLLNLTDILVVNETEAAALFYLETSRTPSVEQWLVILPTLEWQGELLVVTLAERGCVALQSGQPATHQPAWVIAPTDPTGTGDAFTAGLAQAWVSGLALVDALQFANACGAIVAARQAVLPALPTTHQVDTFMAGQSLDSSSK
ncbi:ribokinase [Thiothrix lacustris]|uniref:Ribokinase n=1 Tax=Thiothrix lacustris TaxID=525917 RepID=A0ABY9MLC7_9GAMM|nr:ribokinase [Thiothrix lacustris]WML89469.1 ribokinase [Thiothrix lacustris]